MGENMVQKSYISTFYAKKKLLCASGDVGVVEIWVLPSGGGGEPRELVLFFTFLEMGGDMEQKSCISTC